MNKFLLFLIFLFMNSCFQKKLISYKKNESQDERIVNEIQSKAAKFIEKEKGLKPCGTGAQMMYEVKMLALAFVYNQPIDIQQGRELLVYTVETFLSMINEDERIHPYLFNYPFEPKNVEIEIYIRNPTNSFVEPGKLCLVSAQEGKCTYHVRDTKTGRLETLHIETFQEAKEKIKVNCLDPA